MIRVLIVDDEAPARRKLARLLASAPDVDIVGEASDGLSAVKAIEALCPDLVLLDVRMPGLDGFGVVERVGASRMPLVVFVTAFDDHAVRAFDVEALDYVLKPVSADRFADALERARRELAARGDGSLAARLERLLQGGKPDYLEHVMVWADERGQLIPVERIDRLEADRNTVRVHVGGSTFVVRRSLGELAGRLDPARFLQVNRSNVVRLDAIQ